MERQIEGADEGMLLIHSGTITVTAVAEAVNY